MEITFLTKLYWQNSSSQEKQKIVNAYDCAFQYLSGIKRKCGRSYAVHSVEVAHTLSEITEDPSLQSISLLHDISIHPDKDKIFKKVPLSKKEKGILHILESLKKIYIDSNNNDLNTLIEAFTNDTEVLLIRMAHRLADIRNIKLFKTDLRKKIAQETLYMYTSIADHLGLHAWRYEMEDLAFKCLFPTFFNTLKRELNKYKKIDLACLKLTKSHLKEKITAVEIDCKIEFRIKSIYSTYRKMITKDRKIEDITDRLALRVIVNDIEDCYRVLGIIHSSMVPVHGEFKDYIGNPKKNGYRSIHTVVNPLPKSGAYPIEIQVRTKKMHQECECGIAAHYNYKNMIYDVQYCISSIRVNLSRNIKNFKNKPNSIQEFTTALKNRFDGDKIVIFDKNNKSYYFDTNITALDFVALVYNKKTKFLKNVLINGSKQKINVILQEGNIIDIEFGKKVTILKKWITICKDLKAKKIVEDLLK